MSVGPESKLARVQRLIEWGLNAPLYHVVDHPPDGDHIFIPFPSIYINTVKTLHERFGYNSISIRSDKPVGHSWFHRVGISIEEALSLAESSELFDAAPLLISKGIDYHDSTFSGSIITERFDFLLEVVGPGSNVRDLTWSRKVPVYRMVSDYRRDGWRYHPEPSLVEVIDLVMHCPANPAIFEFSVYPYPIGCFNTNIIFWEVITHGLKISQN